MESEAGPSSTRDNYFVQKRTCPTTLPHSGKNIRNLVEHYFSCIEYHQRDSFFDDESIWSPWRHDIFALLGKKRDVAADIAEQLKRIPMVRKAAGSDNRDIVLNVVNSHERWMQSATYAEGVRVVREWQMQKRTSGRQPDAPRAPAEAPHVERSQESRVCIMREKAKDAIDLVKRLACNEASDMITGSSEPYNLERDVDAFVTNFQQTDPDSYLAENTRRTVHNSHIKGRFPHQRIPLRHLFKELDEITTDYYRGYNYIHIPYNNMQWVEQLIARHYGEDRSRPDSPKPQTDALLHPQLWRGRQNSGENSTAIHARHMRPMCERVAAEREGNSSLDNIVFFMPYLHWETDRKREAMTRVINEAIDTHSRRMGAYMEFEAIARRQERAGLPSPYYGLHTLPAVMGDIAIGMADVPSMEDVPCNVDQFGIRIPWTFKSTATNFVRRRMGHIDNQGRLRVKNRLGQFPLDAARLHTIMSNYRDKEVLHNRLFAAAPLHPRRTLHQAHFWALESTKERDHNQVVYRGTEARWHTTHRVRISDALCNHCQESCRKVPRLVMVDQLWMWILDGKTIITCFPRRYGAADEQEESDVHRAILSRLKATSINQFRSVSEIALVIIDECSKTMFNRTKTAKQPQMLSIFAEAIEKLNKKQAVNSRRVWSWAEGTSQMYRAGSGHVDVSSIYVQLLDISPKKMQHEIKDIIEELEMMLQIQQKQKELVHRLIQQTGAHLPPYEQRSFDLTSSKLLSDLSERVQDLQSLKDSAKRTAQSIDDLLELQQQQADVANFWGSEKRSENTEWQSRVLMVFTVVTIVFLPLSFMSSIFGMNNNNFNDSWTLARQFQLMFPISLGIILGTCLLAFNTSVRDLLWASFLLVVHFLVVWTRLYYVWIRWFGHWRIQDMLWRMEVKMNSLRADVQKEWRTDEAEQRLERRLWSLERQHRRRTSEEDVAVPRVGEV